MAGQILKEETRSSQLITSPQSNNEGSFFLLPLTPSKRGTTSLNEKILQLNNEGSLFGKPFSL